MRRAIALHPTNYNYGHLAVKQAVHSSLFQWLPCFGSNMDPVDTVNANAIRSGHAMNVVLGYDLRRKDLDYDLFRKFTAEWRQIMPYYHGDFYRLTSDSRDEEHWLARQFDRPGQGDGIVEAFRRECTEQASATFHLSGIDASARYEITELDSGRSTILSGSELTERGLPVDIRENPAPWSSDTGASVEQSPAMAAPETKKTRRVLDLDGTWQVEQGELQAMPSEFTHRVVTRSHRHGSASFSDVGKPSSEWRAFWYRRSLKLEGAVPEVALRNLPSAKGIKYAACVISKSSCNGGAR
jgi:hypothetical protein